MKQQSFAIVMIFLSLMTGMLLTAATSGCDAKSSKQLPIAPIASSN